ncbi:MAG: YibE/F family protein [Ilumatobacteraceae bacterium]
MSIGACTTSTPDDPQQCRIIALDLGQAAPPAPRGGGEAPGPTVIEQSTETAVPLHPGDRILVLATTLADGTTSYSFYDFQRTTPLLLLTGLFAIVVIAIGRWRGVGALIGMAASLLLLVSFTLRNLVNGDDPVAIAVITAAAIAIVALYLAQGVRITTSVALLGTLASLAITGLLSVLFVELTHLTGLADEDAQFVVALGGNIDVRGLLLAGFVIGALGVLDDITVTQVSAVAELRAAQPDLTRAQMFRAAMNIGRDHIASTVNTLVLAYAGAALPLLILFVGAHQPLSSIAGREVVATEIVRSLVGSIGLVCAVPITTWLATTVHLPADRDGHHHH